MTDKELGVLIKAVRESLGMTQTQVAGLMPAWHFTTVAKVEKGLRSLKATEIPSLATALGLEPAELLDPQTVEKFARQAIRVKIEKLADLEHKIIGVVVVALVVGFLGKAEQAADTLALLQGGAAIALVIGALCLFLKSSGPSEK